MSVDAIRGRAPDLAVAATTLAALVLVAPLEHAAGMAIGLSWAHAWTVTAVVEGAAGTAVIAGRHVGWALALTGSSVLTGSLWSADRLAVAEGTSLDADPARAVLAGGATVLTVAALALVNWVRRAVLADRAVEDRRVAERRVAERVRAAREEQARVAAAVAEREAVREHEVRLARMEEDRVRAASYAESERERLRLEHERVMADRDREAAEHERARNEHERAMKAHERAVKDREAAVKEHERARNEHERIMKDRERLLSGPTGAARREWHRLDGTGDAPTAEELAEIRGITLGAARNLISSWRQQRPAPAGGETMPSVVAS